MDSPKAAASGERALRRRGCLLLALALASLPAVWSAAAEAAPYDVEICTPAAQGADGIQFSVAQDTTLTLFPCGNQFDGGLRLAGGAGAGNGAPNMGSVQWTLFARPNTTIRTLEANRVFFSWGDSGVQWNVTTGGGALLESVNANGQPPPPSGQVVFPVNSNSVRGRLICPSALGCQGSLGTATIVSVLSVVAHMEDISPPTLTGALGGSLLAGGKVSGTREVSFNASDLGSGISAATLLVDGSEMATLPAPNGGKCVKPYKLVAPCALAFGSSLPLDTTRIANGAHSVQVAIVDAAGQRTTSAPVPFTVENAPAATPPLGAPPRSDTAAPALSGVSLSRTSFRIGVAPTATSSTRRRAVGRGTILRFRSSEVGRLSLDIERVRRGRKARRVASLTRTIEAGPGRVPLSGRIGRKPLAAGSYRVAVTARDAAGNVSTPARRSFRIVPG